MKSSIFVSHYDEQLKWRYKKYTNSIKFTNCSEVWRRRSLGSPDSTERTECLDYAEYFSSMNLLAGTMFHEIVISETHKDNEIMFLIFPLLWAIFDIFLLIF